MFTTRSTRQNRPALPWLGGLADCDPWELSAIRGPHYLDPLTLKQRCTSDQERQSCSDSGIPLKLRINAAYRHQAYWQPAKRETYTLFPMGSAGRLPCVPNDETDPRWWVP